MVLKHALKIAAASLVILAASPFAPGGQPANASDTAERDDDGCPLRFDRHTVGLPRTCMFVGRYSDSCGEPAIAIFAGNGETVAVGLAFGAESSTTYFAGDVVSDTQAALAVWQRSLQQLAASTVAGSVTLEESGNLLRVKVAAPPFQVNGCRFGEFVGRFVEMVDAPDAVPDRAPQRLPGVYQSAQAD